MTDHDDSMNEEVSPRIKAAVIGLTILTSIAGIIFFYLFFSKIYFSSKGSAWGSQLLTVGEKLEKDGLISQAIESYERFLDLGKPDLKTRAKVSLKLANLYRLQNDCSRAISLLYQAELADPKLFMLKHFTKTLADNCKKKLKRN